jgi:hypothetical protein
VLWIRSRHCRGAGTGTLPSAECILFLQQQLPTRPPHVGQHNHAHTSPPPPLLPLCCIACSLKGRVTLASPAPGTPTPPPSLTALGLAPSAAVAIDGVAAAVPEGGWGAGAAGGCVEVAWDGRQQQVLVKVRG